MMSQCESEKLRDVCAWTQRMVAQQSRKNGTAEENAAPAMTGSEMTGPSAKPVGLVYISDDESWCIHRAGDTVPCGAVTAECESEKLRDVCAWTQKMLAQQGPKQEEVLGFAGVPSV